MRVKKVWNIGALTSPMERHERSERLILACHYLLSQRCHIEGRMLQCTVRHHWRTMSSVSATADDLVSRQLPIEGHPRPA